MADIKNTQTSYGPGNVQQGAEFTETTVSSAESAEQPVYYQPESGQAEPKSGESLILADLFKNQLVSDTGGHKVVTSSNLPPTAADSQATANFASESALLQANLDKEAKHAA